MALSPDQDTIVAANLCSAKKFLIEQFKKCYHVSVPMSSNQMQIKPNLAMERLDYDELTFIP
jgi:hypothetical protein